MFFPRAMSELELIVPSKDLMRVMRILSGHGVFHQAESGGAALESGAGPETSWQEKASTYASLERRVQVIRQNLNVQEVPVPSKDFQDLVDTETVASSLDGIESDVKTTTEQLADERRRLEQLLASRRQLEPVSEIHLDMSALRESHYLYAILGVMPAANVTRMQSSLARVPYVFMIMREDPHSPVVWLAGTRSNKDVIQRAARSAYLEPLELPEAYEGTPSQVIQLLDREIDQTRARISALEGALGRLAQSHRDNLLKLAWDIHASRTLAEAIVRFGRLRHTYVMVGWVPTDELELLTQKLRQASKEILVETVPTDRTGDRRNVPVALRSSKFLRPFQMLVTTYARPRYGEIDPTWLIALTFPLLFGAMFGDVGHGLLLAGLGALLASRKVPSLKSMAGLGGLIAVCGIVATAFGFLYGSVFGFEDRLQAIWMHPLENILTILMVAVGAGVALLTIGFIIGIFNAVVSRDWGHLLFGHNGIAGFLLYWSLLGLGASLARFIPAPAIIFEVLAVISGLAIMFSDILIHLVEGERPLIEGGIGTYAIQAPVELFEAVISLLSNSLSYVRVGAFAVAHGGLSSAIFILAKLVGPEFGVGYWVVVAIGNVFIVGFEGLIVGIQTMRLSYYELFSKFFTGGGMRFEPISLTPAQED
jgi:V/A-type H+-transporting ATPase subunit I